MRQPPGQLIPRLLHRHWSRRGRGHGRAGCEPVSEVIVATWRAARNECEDLTEAEVREALHRLDPLWDELFPAERARIVQLLIARVEVDRLGIIVQLRADGIRAVGRDLAPRTKQPARAA